jgi:putative ABC transport system permease protein
MSRLWQDTRLALRGFRRSPAFTVTAVLILGIGIGVASAMWAVTSAVLTRPLPVADQDRIIEPRIRDAAGVDLSMSIPESQLLARSSRTMPAVAGFAHWGAVETAFNDGDRSITIYMAQVTGNFFEVLGTRPFLGRLLRPEDDSTSHVLVLSYGTWRHQFGGDPAIIGRHLFDPYNKVELTIVGVAPPGLDYPIGVGCWGPPRWSVYVDLVARLAPTATLTAARSDFLTAEREINRQRSVGYHIVAVDVKPLREAIVGDIRQTIIVVTAAVALLLLIACVNVGNLLLLRATTRSRELAVRRALGATAVDIFRQLVVESVILAVVGCCLGLVVAAVAERGLIAAAPPQIPNLDVILAAGAPIGTAATVAAFAVVLFGLAPALATIHQNPASPLRVDARSGGTTWQRRRLRHAMVASQVALALIMLTGAGLLTRSLVRLETLPLGYRADHLMMLDLVLPPDLATMSDVLAHYDRIEPHLRALPGVTAMTPVEVGPFLGPNVFTGPWEVEGQSAEQTNSYPLVPIESGGSEYFRTLGTPILRGRGFVDSDREQAPKVAVVSQSVAQMFWPGQDPVGKRLRFLHDTVWRTVVGVSGDIHYRTLRAATPSVFLPFRQYFWQGNILLRSALTPAALMPSIRRAVAEGDPKVGVWDATSMDDLLAGPLAQPRLSTLVLSMFGLVALILAAVGLYGVMASTVREQTRDIGVRMALGATPQRVRGEVLQRAMLVSLGGAAVGVVGALAGSRIIASLLFEVSPTDPVALLVACGVLLAVAGLAAYVPAYRASRIDPSRALQGE